MIKKIFENFSGKIHVFFSLMRNGKNYVLPKIQVYIELQNLIFKEIVELS